MCLQCFPFLSRSNASPPPSPRPSQAASPSSWVESVPLLAPCHTESEAQQQGSYTPPSELLAEISEKAGIAIAESAGLSDGCETHLPEECASSVQASSTPEPVASQVYQLEQVEHTSEGSNQGVLDESSDISYSPSLSTDETPSSQPEDESLAIEAVKPPQYEDPLSSSSSPKHAHKHRHRIGRHLHDLQRHVKQEGHRHLHSLYNGAKQQVSEIRASLSTPRE